MSRMLVALGLVSCLTIFASRVAWAESEVFDGDPTDPSTGKAYEILPGHPLVQPGPDGVLGTSDDVIDPTVIGDVDLVVRVGSVTANPAIPPPAALAGRAGLPTGVAGPETGGGVEIEFSAFLCGGGCYGENPAAPYGTVLHTNDMNDFPVIVAAFADLDGDGFIGPTVEGAARSPGAAAVQVRELEPVGRAVANFDDGVAHGKLAIHAGLPASQGGLAVAIVAAASSGPYNPGTNGGVVGSGTGIVTALPFLPQADFTRFLRATAEIAGPGTTIYPLIQFAAIPTPGWYPSYALPLDGSSPTIDAAVIYSQPAVRVALRDDPGRPEEQIAAKELVFGTAGSVKRRTLRLVAVDRLDNPADPPPNLAVKLAVTPPLKIAKPRSVASDGSVAVSTAGGRKIVLKAGAGATSGTAGMVTVERDGVVVAAHSYTIDARRNRPPADAVVPGAEFSTIQSALDGAADVNGDGSVVISVRPGVFRERLNIARPLVLQGAGAERTIVQGDGSGPVVAVSSSGVTLRGFTAVGGTTGFALDGDSAVLSEVRAWHNDGAGITVSAASARLWRSAAIDNTGDGLAAQGADGLACERATVQLNGGAGVRVVGGTGARLEDSSIASNTGSGLMIVGSDLTARGNHSIVNLSSGIETANSIGAQLMDNFSATNDADGLHMDTPSGDVVWGNVLDNNGQYGLWLNGAPNADFSPAPGQQAPIGNNTTAANQEGPTNLDN